jgi:hypothetical protein
MECAPTKLFCPQPFRTLTTFGWAHGQARRPWPLLGPCRSGARETQARLRPGAGIRGGCWSESMGPKARALPFKLTVQRLQRPAAAAATDAAAAAAAREPCPERPSCSPAMPGTGPEAAAAPPPRHDSDYEARTSRSRRARRGHRNAGPTRRAAAGRASPGPAAAAATAAPGLGRRRRGCH